MNYAHLIMNVLFNYLQIMNDELHDEVGHDPGCVGPDWPDCPTLHSGNARDQIFIEAQTPGTGTLLSNQR